MAKKIGDNTGSLDALLRAVKEPAVSIKLENGLKSNEEKLANSILNVIFEKFDSAKEYSLKLTSKNTDALMGRITTLLEKNAEEFTNSLLENAKEEILAKIDEAKSTNTNSIDINECLDDLKTSIYDSISTLLAKHFEEIKLFLEALFVNVLNNEDAINADLKNSIEAAKASIESTTNSIEEAVSTLKSEAADSRKKMDEESSAAKDTTAETNSKLDTSIENGDDTAKTEIKEKETDKSLTDLNEPIDIDAEKEELKKYLEDNSNNLKDALVASMNNIAATIIGSLNTVIDLLKSLESNLSASMNSLTPDEAKLKKEKKKKEKDDNQTKSMLSAVNLMMKKISDIMDNFVDFLVTNLKTFLKKAKSAIIKFVIETASETILPIMLLIAAFLYLLKDPLKDLILPIFDFIDSMSTKLLEFLTPIRDFLIDTLKRLFNIIAPVLEAFFTALKPFAKDVAIGLGLFVKSVLDVLKLFMDGIASGALQLGEALVTFATVIVDTLAEFMRGISTMAFDIGKGLGRFVRAVVNALADLMEGFGTKTKEIGEAIGNVVLGVVEVVDLLVKFLKECVEILVAIVGTIKDFFEGIRSKAKEIGEMIGTIIYNFFKGFNTKAEEIGIAVADLALVTSKLLTKIFSSLLELGNIVRLYIIAPLAGLKRWLNSKIISLENSIWVPTFEWGTPSSSNLTGIGDVIDRISGMSFYKNYIFLGQQVKFGGSLPDYIPNPDEGKSIGELVNEEMEKTKAAIEEEKAAAEAERLAAQLKLKKIEDLLNNMHFLEDTFNFTRSLYKKYIGNPDELKETTAEDILNKAEEASVDPFESLKTFLNEMSTTIQSTLILKNIDIANILIDVALKFSNNILDAFNRGYSLIELLIQATKDKLQDLTTAVEAPNEDDNIEQLLKSIDLLNEKTQHLAAAVESCITSFVSFDKSLLAMLEHIDDVIDDAFLENKNLKDSEINFDKLKEAIESGSCTYEEVEKLLLKTEDSLKAGNADSVTMAEFRLLSNTLKLMKPVQVGQEAPSTVQVSVLSVVPEIKNIDNINDLTSIATNDLSKNLTEQQQPKKEPKGNEQSKFNQMLMNYLEGMFSEVLEKLNNTSLPSVIPLPIGGNTNLATLEN